MKETRGYVNLDYVVRSVMSDLKQYTFHNYQALLQLAAEGFTDLNLFVTNNVKVAYLPINENFTVDLPEDFIDYVKIGILLNGKVWTLGYNKDIALPRTVDRCGNTLPSIVSCSSNDDDINFPTWGFYFANHFRNGQYVGELYGLGGGFNFAYYTIDHDKRQIVLTDGVPKEEIILEYKSSGIDAEGSTTIPRQAVRAIKEYVHWKRLEYDERVAMNIKMRREDQYYIQYEKLRFLESSFTLEEYLDHTYAESQSSPRR